MLDEAALAGALRRSGIRGAALDVFAARAAPRRTRRCGACPNVLVTPHVSGTTRGFWRREADLIVENLRRYLAGRPLLNGCDKQAGY